MHGVLLILRAASALVPNDSRQFGEQRPVCGWRRWRDGGFYVIV